MRQTGLNRVMISGRLPLILAFFLFLALKYFGQGEEQSLYQWLCVLMQTFTAAFILFLNQNFIIIKTRTLLPGVFYLLFAATDIFPFAGIDGYVASICVVASLFFLFGSYQDPLSQTNAFTIGLILSTGSLLWPYLAFFFPLVWVGMYRLQCFNIRSFFANLSGIAIVCLFLFAWSLYKDDISLFTEFFRPFENLFDVGYPEFRLSEYLFAGYLLLLFIISGSRLLLSDSSEKVKSKITLNFLFLMGIILFILLIIQSQWRSEWQGLLYIPVSILAGHYFSTVGGKWSSRFLIFSIVYFIGLYFASTFWQ